MRVRVRARVRVRVRACVRVRVRACMAEAGRRAAVPPHARIGTGALPPSRSRRVAAAASDYANAESALALWPAVGPAAAPPGAPAAAPDGAGGWGGPPAALRSGGRRRRLHCAAWSPDGRRVAAGADDGAVCLWTVAHG